MSLEKTSNALESSVG